MEKIKLLYPIKPEEWLEGYDLYQKMYRRKFTYIKACAFLIPLILFLQQIWIDPYFTVGYICIAVCVGAIVCIFLTPGIERKTTERALEAIKDDNYVLTLFDDRIEISTVLPESDEKFLEPDESGAKKPLPEIAPTVILLSEKNLRAVETEKIIGVFTSKTSAVIPKSALNDRDVSVLKTALNI